MAKQSEFGKYVTWAQLQRVVALAIEAAIEVSADRGPLHCLDGSIETVLDEKPKPTIRSEAKRALERLGTATKELNHGSYMHNVVSDVMSVLKWIEEHADKAATDG